MVKDAYSILGVERTDSADIIKRAYRKLARKYHPDITGDDGRLFSEVQDAYLVITGMAERKSIVVPENFRLVHRTLFTVTKEY